MYEGNAAKKNTTVSINQQVLEQARALGVNLSGTLEARLIELIQEHQRRTWREENREAIDSYNERIETQGTFSDGLRRF